MTQILNAAPIRDHYIPELKKQCEELKANGVTPSLKVILVGNHPPSLIYTRNKKTFIESLGALCEIIHLDETITESELTNEIDKMATDKKVHGCFVQLPLPTHLQDVDVKQLIPANKDVDGFHQDNLMKVLCGDQGEEALLPCTPKGIMTMLDYYDVEVEGKHAVVIGRSMIVGKPMAMLLTNANATVTLCHSRTPNLAEHTKRADIIISAVGRAKFLNQDYIDADRKQIVIDVGMNHDENKKLCGDVDFEQIKAIVQGITPVPGGVGPMTIFSLAQNLLQAAKKTL